jgi:hypothetical protein
VVRPYVGITGFMTTEEVNAVYASIPPDLLRNRDLMVGVLVSSKTRDGGTNRHPKKYPKPPEWPEIFSLSHEHLLGLVHYSTDYPQCLGEEMIEVGERCCWTHDGFQVNEAWPRPSALLGYRMHHATMVFGSPQDRQKVRVVLQFGDLALQAISDREDLTDRVAEYWKLGAISDILIDPSGEKGLLFYPDQVRGYLRALQSRCPGLGLGVAGGLSAETLLLVKPLIPEFPNLSIDAEGRLRDSVSGDLDIKKATDYVVAALQIFQA